MVDAQFSMPFGAALTLSRGTSSLADFQNASSLAAQLQPLMDLTTMHTSAELDAAYPAQWGAEVTLSFADGKTVELRTPAFRGSPGWPAGQPEIEAKAAGLLGEAAARGLFATVAALGADKVFDPGLVATAARAGSP
jgi:2-methylcitrate dehydratase PrpD